MEEQDLNALHINTYSQIAEQFAADVELVSSVTKFLDKLVVGLPKDGLIVDIGCGPGQYSNYLSQFGRTQGVDLSPNFIEIARKKYTQVEFVVGDMRHLGFPDHSVDRAALIASLLHIPKAEAPAVLREVYRILKPDGIVVLSMKTPMEGASGDGLETYERSGKVVTRYFARYTEEELTKLLEQAGFKVVEMESHNAPKKNRSEQWIEVLAEVKND